MAYGGGGRAGYGPGDQPDDVPFLIVGGILLAFVVVLVALVPVAGAALVFFGLRRFLARRDWVILAAGGVIGFALNGRTNAVGYGEWMLGFINVGPGDPGSPPVTVLLCMAAALAGLAGIIQGPGVRGAAAPTSLGRWMRRKKMFTDVIDGTWMRRKEFVDESITPPKGRRGALRRAVSRKITVRDIPAVRGPYATAGSRQMPLKSKAIPIGLGFRGKPVPLSVQEMGMHGCVVGSTGSGKTVTLMWIIGAALDMGYDVTVLDMKEDTEPGGLRDFLRAYGWSHRLPLQEIALADERPTAWFNVLDGMTADEAYDTIISMVDFDDSYWQSLNRKVLQQVVQLCYQAAQAAPDRFDLPTMLRIGKIMEQGAKMRNVVRDEVTAIDAVHGSGHCLQRYANVLRPSDDEAKSAASFGTRLTGLYDSGAGRRILVPGGDREMIDVRRGGLTYIGLNSLGQPDMARILSASALQRLSVEAAQRIQGRAPKERPRLIVVDEASFIPREIAMNMLSRVRSADFSMIVCTQGPTDWIDKDGDDWSRLAQNINWLFAMAQSSPESAEKCADFLGMRDNFQLSERAADEGPSSFNALATVREQYIVFPKDLRDLGTGEGYLRVNKPESRTEYAIVPMRTEEMERYEAAVRRSAGAA